MTERIFWTPPSPDGEPLITLNSEHGKVELKRTNTAVYSYVGNLALFNHIHFIGSNELNPFYVFGPAKHLKVLRENMLRLKYPHFKDQTWVDGVDIDAYEAHVKALDRSSIEDVVAGWSDSHEE